MPELAARIDPLEFHLFQSLSRRVREHRFAECDNALLDTRNGTLEKDEVVLDGAVADEAAHSGDVSVEA